MPTPQDLQAIDARLDEIGKDVREVRQLLIGNGGDGGVFGRLLRIEERHGFLTTCYLWLLSGVLALLAMVVPSYFQHK